MSQTERAWCKAQAYTVSVSLPELGNPTTHRWRAISRILGGLRTFEALNKSAGGSSDALDNAPAFCGIVCFQRSKPAAKIRESPLFDKCTVQHEQIYIVKAPAPSSHTFWFAAALSLRIVDSEERTTICHLKISCQMHHRPIFAVTSKLHVQKKACDAANDNRTMKVGIHEVRVHRWRSVLPVAFL